MKGEGRMRGLRLTHGAPAPLRRPGSVKKLGRGITTFEHGAQNAIARAETRISQTEKPIQQETET